MDNSWSPGPQAGEVTHPQISRWLAPVRQLHAVQLTSKLFTFTFTFTFTRPPPACAKQGGCAIVLETKGARRLGPDLATDLEKKQEAFIKASQHWTNLCASAHDLTAVDHGQICHVSHAAGVCSAVRWLFGCSLVG